MGEPLLNQPTASPRITLRVPGAWAHPGKLLERLPAGVRLTPESLLLPDGTAVEFIPMPPDVQFARVFASACRRPPTREEQETLGRYTVNVGLSGPGGSLAAALAMMRAAAAIVRAGGAGVFIDNSAVAHGGSDWLAMTDDGGPEAISYAFTTVIEGRHEVETLGLQTLGLPNFVVRRGEIDARGGDWLIEIIRELCRSGRGVDVGHVFADEAGPQFRAVARMDDEFDAESPMHNPYGRLRIASLRSLAEEN